MKRSSELRGVGLALACALVATVPATPAASAENASASLRSQVQGLLDREAIRQLPILYCHYIWTKNADAVVDLFTKDASFDVPPSLGLGDHIVGTDALQDLYKKGVSRGIAGLDPLPFIHNHYVELLGGGKAKGFVYAEIRNQFDNNRVAMLVVYEDSYVKENGRWKFAKRKLTVIDLPKGSTAGGLVP